MNDEHFNEVCKRVLEDKMLWLGFRDNLSGTPMLKMAVAMWQPGMQMGHVYDEVAKACSTLPSRAERCMRHAIETAWDRGDAVTIDNTFGYTVSAAKGKPTVGEFVSRMARICGYAD